MVVEDGRVSPPGLGLYGGQGTLGLLVVQEAPGPPSRCVYSRRSAWAMVADAPGSGVPRSEERRVGKECRN